MTSRMFVCLVSLGFFVTALTGEADAAEPAPSLFDIDTVWESDDGRSLKLKEIGSAPVVVAMVYTSCSSACPATVTVLKAVETKLSSDARKQARFVLVSLDPARDTTQALRHFRKHHGLDDNWVLLRGSADDVRELAVALEIQYQETRDDEIVHSSPLTVLNRAGRVELKLETPAGDMAALIGAIERLAAVQ